MWQRWIPIKVVVAWCSKIKECNYCSKTFNGGIFIFKHHIAGTIYDSEPCASVPEEVKVVMMKVVAEVDTNQSSSSMMFKNKGMEKFSQGVQSTLN